MNAMQERLVEDMTKVMMSGDSDAIAEMMLQRHYHDELLEMVKEGKNRDVIEEAGQCIASLEGFLGRKPEFRTAFGFTLSSFYSFRSMAYTALGNQNRDTAMKKLALQDCERARSITQLPPKVREAEIRHSAALKAEIAQEEKKQKCFIATAAYGSALAPDVVVLQRFRDTKLRPNRPGRWLIHLYERFSPPLADAIAPHPVARLWVRRLILAPIVWLVHRWISD